MLISSFAGRLMAKISTRDYMLPQTHQMGTPVARIICVLSGVVLALFQLSGVLRYFAVGTLNLSNEGTAQSITEMDPFVVLGDPETLMIQDYLAPFLFAIFSVVIPLKFSTGDRSGLVVSASILASLFCTAYPMIMWGLGRPQPLSRVDMVQSGYLMFVPWVFLPQHNKKLWVLGYTLICFPAVFMMTSTSGSYVVAVTISLYMYFLHSAVSGFFDRYLLGSLKKEAQMESTRAVLEDLLPKALAHSLLQDPDSTVGVPHPQPKIVFMATDLVHFTALAESLGPRQTFAVLHRLQDSFDSLGLIHRAMKVETVGDATEYILPNPEDALARSNNPLTLQKDPQDITSSFRGIHNSGPTRAPSGSNLSSDAEGFTDPTEVSSPLESGLLDPTPFPGAADSPMVEVAASRDNLEDSERYRILSSLQSDHLTDPELDARLAAHQTAVATNTGSEYHGITAQGVDVKNAVELGLDLLFVTHIMSMRLTKAVGGKKAARGKKAKGGARPPFKGASAAPVSPNHFPQETPSSPSVTTPIVGGVEGQEHDLGVALDDALADDGSSDSTSSKGSNAMGIPSPVGPAVTSSLSVAPEGGLNMSHSDFSAHSKEVVTKSPHLHDEVRVRIGLAMASAITGVVGRDRPQFLALGEAVFHSLFLEQSGQPCTVHISCDAGNLLVAYDRSYSGYLRECPESCKNRIKTGNICYFMDLESAGLSDVRRDRVEGVCSSAGSSVKHSSSSLKMLMAARGAASLSSLGSTDGGSIRTSSGTGLAEKSRKTPNGRHSAITSQAGSVARSNHSSAISAGFSAGEAMSMATSGTRGSSASASRHYAHLHSLDPRRWWLKHAHPVRDPTRSRTEVETATTGLKIYLSTLIVVLVYAVLLRGAVSETEKLETLTVVFPYAVLILGIICIPTAIHLQRRFKTLKAWMVFAAYVYLLVIRSLAKRIIDPNSPYDAALVYFPISCAVGLFLVPARVIGRFLAIDFVVLAAIFKFGFRNDNYDYPVTGIALSFLVRAVFIFAANFLEQKRIHWAELVEELVSRHHSLNTLLNRMLPENVAEKLIKDPQAFIAENFTSVTLLFLEVDIEPWLENYGPAHALELLSLLWESFDELCLENHCRPIESVRGEYLASSGDLDGDPAHVQNILGLAISMRRATSLREARSGIPHSIKIGVHSGSVTCGPVGAVKRAYKFTGDTVNTTARYKAYCPVPNGIHVSLEVRDAALSAGYTFERKADVWMKGKGLMASFILP